MNAVEALSYLLLFLVIPGVFVALIARYDARERRAAQQPAPTVKEPTLTEIERFARLEAAARQARKKANHE